MRILIKIHDREKPERDAAVGVVVCFDFISLFVQRFIFMVFVYGPVISERPAGWTNIQPYHYNNVILPVSRFPNAISGANTTSKYDESTRARGRTQIL